MAWAYGEVVSEYVRLVITEDLFLWLCVLALVV